MNGITWIHIAGGVLALVAGAIAVAVRKGRGVHASAGTWFCVSMFVLGITASILAPFKSPPDSPIGGVMVCYFVATAWMTARRRNGTPGRFEKIACAIGLAIGIAIIGEGIRRALSPTPPSAPPGAGVLLVLGAICLLAGLGDLKFILRGKASTTQRISRHLWRMCFAFFIATGSFFLGQQDVLPQAVRGSAILFVLALAPIALMLFWLVRVRFAKVVSGLKLPDAASAIPAENRRHD
ncbi:MAG TPA: hypothetical protein VGD21_01240 [Lysobacter sp.]